MTKRSFSITLMTAIGSLVAIAQPSFGGTTPASASQNPRVLLEEMRETASSTAEQADRLKMDASNAALSSDSHLSPLWALKDDVNTMNREISSLEAERDTLQPWEQQAIDKVMPMLREAATNTEDAIQFFNNNHNFLWSPQYRAYVANVKRDSDQITKTLKDYLKYEKVQHEEEQLRNTITPGAN
ncbi:hypothetical protein [Paludibaculum fermentans]|uniref:Uncharacterized protein n=1 Tax=Paludibaculum fermentans TaxID=1473598 RepID=A0A7S7NSB2_PALFE|nr:hypothetical protein [Paludibaculum fermentans]QOY88800.1 hypothetical protein IRI77_02230 [Paludibaculum fermentans]